jgi:RND family efflux transporter MFP subunit
MPRVSVSPSSIGSRPPKLVSIRSNGKALRDVNEGGQGSPSGSIVDPSSYPVYLQGIAKPQRDSVLKPQAAGTVVEIHVHEGQWVQKDQPLLTLDSAVARASVKVAAKAAAAKSAILQAELEVEAVAAQLARMEAGLQSNAASQFEVEAKRNEYEQAIAKLERQVEAREQAQAELQLAQAQLEQRTLKAPFAGQVLQIDAQLGSSIEPTETAIRIADLKELSVEMHLPLSFFGVFEQNESYLLHAAAPVNAALSGVAKYVSPVVEPTSGTFRVSFSIDNSQEALPAGFELRLPLE